MATCVICGSKFSKTNSRQMKCPECSELKGIEKAEKESNRIFYRGTVNLICKYYKEGMSIKAIMRDLCRSEANVKKALRLGGINLKTKERVSS